MSDKMREEFEAWIKTEFDGCMPRRKGKGYLSQYVNGAWKAWKASRAALHVNACAGMADPAAEIAELKRQRDELLAALHDAATSLETIQLRSFGANSFLDDKILMREYAGFRAFVARESIAAARGSAS